MGLTSHRHVAASCALAALFGAPAALAEELPPGHPPIAGHAADSAELPPGHPPIGAHAKGKARGVALPFDLRLHGRFDVSYERHTYSDAFWDGKDAFRNYHRFLFLERRAKDDPFFFSAELLGATFYEIGARFKGDKDEIWRLNLAAGKVLVPFGADPLYHHAYGGRVGADQRVLPIVWAEFGLKGTLDLDLSPFALKIDAFALRGYALRAADGILNLQSGMAPTDDLNFAGGGRVSLSYGGATINYSVYGGTLDFDRSLLMQAFDITLWRLDLPVLRDFAITAGVLRADVFGGDIDSYYHFADYLQVRYYPTDCLFIQYRGGLDMRDNREGVFADGTRLDKFDTSAHSLSVGWIHNNFSLVLQHIWQLELVDEQDDDVLRLTATYEF